LPREVEAGDIGSAN